SSSSVGRSDRWCLAGNERGKGEDPSRAQFYLPVVGPPVFLPLFLSSFLLLVVRSPGPFCTTTCGSRSAVSVISTAAVHSTGLLMQWCPDQLPSLFWIFSNVR